MNIPDAKRVWQMFERLPVAVQVGTAIVTLAGIPIMIVRLAHWWIDNPLRQFFKSERRKLDLHLPSPGYWSENSLLKLFPEKPKWLRSTLLRLEREGLIYQLSETVWKLGKREDDRVKPRT